MIHKTYEGWKKERCHVVRGEKSHKRNKDGKALFSEDQVEEDMEDDDFYDALDGYDMDWRW
jgi:hypothetical protein